MGFLRVNVNKAEKGENPEIAGEIGPPAQKRRETVAITLKKLQERSGKQEDRGGKTNSIETYKINNQNSVYYLKPGTDEMYLLDLKQRSFVLETLEWNKSSEGPH
jgi:hypothetical protein